MRNRTVLAAAAAVAAGCGGGTSAPAIADECNPLPPTPLPPDTNQPPPTDNGTHSGINSKPAALRMVESFLLAPQQATDGCLTGGSPAPCDCATGACN